MKESDTPRTDAVFWKFHTHDDMVNLARDLERELTISLQNQVKAQTEVERLKRLLSDLLILTEKNYWNSHNYNQIKASLSSPSSL